MSISAFGANRFYQPYGNEEGDGKWRRKSRLKLTAFDFSTSEEASEAFEQL